MLWRQILLPILRCSSSSVAFMCEFEFIRNGVMIIQEKEENFKQKKDTKN